MLTSLKPEMVLALAPDAPSIKAARSLSHPKPWSTLGQNGRSIWGACQGSGKDPYLTQVDWEGPAFKCTCPSRKFPCKHGLALLLLVAEQPSLVSLGDEPEWVKNWIATRQQRAQKKEEAAPPVVDEAARDKRTEQRAGRVADGIDSLELWLRDLVQQGLVSVPGRGFAFWDEQAKRLVDAQAPGIARLVRDLGSAAVSGEGWQQRMLRAVGRIWLLIHANRRMEFLPPQTQADVRTAVGFTMAQSDVLSIDPVRDSWLVAGQRIMQEDRMRVQRTWLVGERTTRKALVLEFAAGTSGFKTSLVPGTFFEGALCFFPSAAPLRALVKEVFGAPSTIATAVLPNAGSVSEAYEESGDRLAMNPWTETQPVFLRQVIAMPSANRWMLVDQTNAAMPCVPDYAMLALSGGRPIDIVGEWDERALKPLMAVVNGRFAPIRPLATP